MYRSGQFECNCITDLSLNIQPTISLQPFTLYLYGVDRPAHMLSMINGFIVHIHGHVSRRPCPGSVRTFTTYPGRDALLRHTRVRAQFNDIPGSTVNWVPIILCKQTSYPVSITLIPNLDRINASL